MTGQRTPTDGTEDRGQQTFGHSNPPSTRFLLRERFMSASIDYNLQNLVHALIVTSDLKNREVLVVAQLLTHIEDQLEAQHGTGAPYKYFCTRATFDRYVKLAGAVEDGHEIDLRPFSRAMKAIKPPAFLLLIEYCRMIDPTAFD